MNSREHLNTYINGKPYSGNTIQPWQQELLKGCLNLFNHPYKDGEPCVPLAFQYVVKSEGQVLFEFYIRIWDFMNEFGSKKGLPPVSLEFKFMAKRVNDSGLKFSGTVEATDSLESLLALGKKFYLNMECVPYVH